MLMQVHEAWRNHEAGSIDHACTLEGLLRDRGDLSFPDPEVPDGIEPRFGVHHAAVGDYQVVRSRRLACAGAQRDQRHDQ